MSRLTASSLFHKPSSLLIHTPPESITASPPNPANLQDPSPESAGTRLRLGKPSSIPYHKEKGQQTRKPLIIVIPSPTLLDDHGHTLSNGPFHRLSEGVAMPLFPSMTTQLAAIAREFSFPSTSGLCLYFHHVEDGLTLKPRISDDSWPSIWGYLSDPLGPNERRPLFSGRVEFDIDLRLARWYTSWLSSIHRELSDYHAQPLPSTGRLSTHSHFRGESQDTLPERRSFDVDVAEDSFTQPSEHNRRHVPRRLSLAERLDLVPVRPDVSRSAFPPPGVQSAGSQVLSTIVQVQEEDPKASRDTLDTRVKSWRESALLIPNPFIATGKTSLNPANDMLINNELLLASAELKMEEFTWSISSAGPKSYDSSSSVSDIHVPSVHLASRLAGTVCSTPSICTSFGPDSSENISPISWDRAPSVHLASRLAGSVCTTPSTRTSFGPEGGAPFSPLLDIYRVSTPDVAHRLYESVPSTPQTATTWGAPLSYPPSPRCLSPSPSLDLGERSMSAEFELSLPPFLSRGSSDTVVWPHVWPYIATKIRPPAVASHDIGTNSRSSYPYPYLGMYPAIPGAMTISSQSTSVPSSNSTLDIHVGFKISSVYPSFDIYPAVYPFNLQRIYPSIPISTTIISRNTLNLVPDSPPEIKVEFKSPCVYPSFCLYPAVYPFNLEELYPVIVTQSHSVLELSEGYPYFNIYPPLSPPFYAHLALYNYHPLSQYPEFQIYHDLPALDCFTVQDMASEGAEADISQSIHLRKYPILNIYPAVYPFFDLYPAIEECKQAHVPVYGSNCELSLSTTVESVYPFFNIYPPVYPHLEIYPFQQATAYQAASEQENLEQAADPTFSQDLGQSSRLYPFFNLYPTVYPHFDLYPAPGGSNVLSQPSTPKLLRSSSLPSNTVEHTYPAFNLYPAVYPYFDFYLPLPQLEIQPPSGLNKGQAKSSSRLTHSELHAMVMMEIIEPVKLFGRLPEGMKNGHLGLDVHGHMGSSSFSQTPSLSIPLRDIFGECLHNVERRSEMPPQRKVENTNGVLT